MSDSVDQSAFLLDERAFYVGNAWAGVLVGVNTTVGLLAVVFLRNHPAMSFRQRAFYIAYVLTIIVLMILALFGNVYMGQRMWIDDRFSEGGPYAYFVANSAAWWNTLGSATDIVIVWMGDALLLYRCYIIWSGKWKVIVLPALIYLASIALSLCVLVESALPATKAFFAVGQLINFTVPWIALTSALNVILTALICYRILRVRFQLRSALKHDIELLSLSDYDNSTMYTSVISMLVESALPLAVIGLVTCVLVGKGNFASTPFLVIWGTVAGISPLLIVARIAMGMGWTRNTSSKLDTSIVFAPAPKPEKRSRRTYTTATTDSTGPFDPTGSDFAQRIGWDGSGSRDDDDSAEKV
ncbi:unnamed protein product [Peniophora sp. CBMAI 1063]|nr:unnamed protein product [Peniophora sp. CBMAI 1063]